MSEWLHNIWSGLTTVSLDQANCILGVFGVWLMIRRSLWSFPVGLVSVLVQGILFWEQRLFAESKVQIFYCACLAYGWWHWVKHKGAAPELPITILRTRSRIGYALAGCVGAILWAEYLRNYTSAAAPYRDAFLASFGVMAQIMQSRKNIDNWPLWVAVDAMSVLVYLQLGKDMAYTAFLYAIYMAMALGGWIEWARAMRKASQARDAEVKT